MKAQKFVFFISIFFVFGVGFFSGKSVNVQGDNNVAMKKNSDETDAENKKRLNVSGSSQLKVKSSVVSQNQTTEDQEQPPHSIEDLTFPVEVIEQMQEDKRIAEIEMLEVMIASMKENGLPEEDIALASEQLKGLSENENSTLNDEPMSELQEKTNEELRDEFIQSLEYAEHLTEEEKEEMAFDMYKENNANGENSAEELAHELIHDI